jgi:NADH-quinone oxidoreductase subunit N
VYAATVLGAFGVVVMASVRGEQHTSLSSYAGLARRRPFLGIALAAFLLSLAGIPPMAGFIAKVSVFSAAVQSGYWPLVLVAVLASVAAAFFYIRVIVLMYMQEPMRELESVRIEREPAGMVAIAIPAILTVLLGILPGALFGFLRTASVIRF